MRNFAVFVWRRHRIAGLVTAAALAALVFFASHFVAGAIYFANPANRDRPLEPWMSPRYVSQSWGLPRPVMLDIIGVDPDMPPKEVPRTVGQILEYKGITLEELQARVESAKDAMRMRHGR